LIAGCSSLLVSCGNPVATVRPPDPVSEEQILQAHRKLAVDQQIEIEAFINRKGWPADIKRTESGLYMLICKDTATVQGAGTNVLQTMLKYGDTAQLLVNIKLLNGTEIFNGTQTVIAGKTEMIAGLRQALSKMHYGESACLIVPSHLAYGFSGDGCDVPAHATLLYELKIKNK
jgi:FKBP-type peptidyl-prolyl cis-trans isomerase